MSQKSSLPQVTRFVSEALMPDMAAPYIHPRPQPEARVVAFDLHEDIGGSQGLLAVHEALLRGTATGNVALEDAKDISAMLETHRRLVETVDLEQRTARLEAEQAKGSDER